MYSSGLRGITVENNPFIPKVYIYLDGEGIKSLFSQLAERMETEHVQGLEKDSLKGIEGKVGIGQEIGVINASMKGAVGKNEKYMEHSTSRFTIEGEINSLLQRLDRSICFTDLAKAANFILDNKKSAFINIVHNFNMPQFSHENGVDEVNRDMSLSFIIGQPNTEHDFDDSYFRKTHYTFFMQASLNKTTRSYSYMSFSGHDAVFFRAHKGKDVPLGVFGLLTNLSQWTFQIKPFAIWIQ